MLVKYEKHQFKHCESGDIFDFQQIEIEDPSDVIADFQYL